VAVERRPGSPVDAVMTDRNELLTPPQHTGVRQDGAVPIDADALDALLPDLDDAPGPHLDAARPADGLRFAGLALTGNASGMRFLECVLEGCDLGGVAFDRARFTSCRLTEVQAPAWTVPDGTLLDVVVTGGRFGALTAHGSELTRVLLDGVKVDLLGLGSARLVDVTLRGCTIGELDLTAADLRDVRLEDCTVERLTVAGARCRAVDLRGAALGGLDDVGALSGATISAAQLTALAPALAARAGLTVR
jgi:uncharacterized protein YjbI with pentapeptide repeats